MDASTFHPPPRLTSDAFLDEIGSYLPLLAMPRVILATQTCVSGHGTQRRQDGSWYFEHPMSSALIYVKEGYGRDPEVVINILLHDLKEESDYPSQIIRERFGEEREKDLEAITKRPRESTEEYILRLRSGGPRVMLAKLPERLHNLRTLSHCNHAKKLRQVRETYAHHLPVLVPALIGLGPSWRYQTEILESLLRKQLKVVRRELDITYERLPLKK